MKKRKNSFLKYSGSISKGSYNFHNLIDEVLEGMFGAGPGVSLEPDSDDLGTAGEILAGKSLLSKRSIDIVE